MSRFLLAGAAIALIVLITTGARGQCDGTGECFCSENGTVGIAQLVRAVNIALGTAACPAPPGGCAEPPAGASPVCGDGVCHFPEECDVGGICVGGSRDLDPCVNPADCPGGRCTTVGGQPDPAGSCAANCTVESARTASYADGSKVFVQTLAFAVPIEPSGTETLRTGSPRFDDTIGVHGDVLFHAGDIPVVTKPEDVQVRPIPVLGLTCACLRASVVPVFGPGNSGRGVIACGGPLPGVDILTTQDHHTDPLASFSPIPGCSRPPDPECDDEREIVPGVVSRACREQSDLDCDDPSNNRHTGVCNSPRETIFSGSGPTGSALISRRISITLLMDQGVCDLSLGGMSPCRFADYGPDCLPCTDDDPERGRPETFPATTGIADSILYNATNRPNALFEGSGTPCEGDQDCGATACGTTERCLPRDASSASDKVCGRPCGPYSCRTKATGHPFDCEALRADPGAGLGGGALAQSFPDVDAPTIGDNVTTYEIIFE